MASCPCQKCSHVAQAYRTGLRGGDTVLSIDGDSTEGMEMPERIKRLRGQDGVEVTLEASKRGTVTVVEFIALDEKESTPTEAQRGEELFHDVTLWA